MPLPLASPCQRDPAVPLRCHLGRLLLHVLAQWKQLHDFVILADDFKVRREAEEAFGAGDAEPSRAAAEGMAYTLSALKVPASPLHPTGWRLHACRMHGTWTLSLVLHPTSYV
jgi:hypothetical protein